MQGKSHREINTINNKNTKKNSGKESNLKARDARDVASILGWGRVPGGGNAWQPTPIFLLEKSHG